LRIVDCGLTDCGLTDCGLRIAPARRLLLGFLPLGLREPLLGGLV
jgi:hypothetical protein